MRSRTSSLLLALVVAGCNALTGVSDLSVCSEDCGAGPDGGALTSTDAGSPDVEVDGAVALPPTCTAGERLCTGKIANECAGDAWKPTKCSDRCVEGACVLHGSCQNAAGTGCGTSNVSCCATETVPGGTFLRANNPAYPATVSDFELERFEVTVGRFRAFVSAGGVSKLNPPAPGAGAHPKIPDSGWQLAWNDDLPNSLSDLTNGLDNGTWTPTAGANEHKPITRASWLVAFAFCAWDGARLPTYAEWSLAAVGGSEQRVYPWSVPSSSTAISATNAAYNCNFTLPAKSCSAQHCSTGVGNPCGVTCQAPAFCVTPCSGCNASIDIAPVGSLAAGASRWGHFDLSGNVEEYTLDENAPLVPCSDCARLGEIGKAGRDTLLAGGAWGDSATAVTAATYQRRPYDSDSDTAGFRCAR